MVYLISIHLVSISPENWQKISPIFTGSREIQSEGAGSQSMAAYYKIHSKTIWIALKALQWVLFEPLSCNGWIRMPLLRINSDFLYSTQPNLKYE